MEIRCIANGRTATVKIKGELDHHSAEKTRREVDAFLESEPLIAELVLDMAEVCFMDSSGLGVVLGRYKKMRERDGVLKIANAGGHAESIMQMSGVFSIIEKTDNVLKV